MHEGVRQVETVFFLLLFFIVIFGTVAQRLKLAYPIVLVLAGLLVSLIPGLPRVTLEPDLIFLVILPPLLFSAAWQTSWREFRFNLVSILMLAFGLVAFTVFGVAVAGEKVFSLLYWRTGFVLGAIVAPTDAIAATSIARRIGLPSRITDLLEGESLVNDATGLLALEFGIALVVKGHAPTVGAGFARLVWLVLVGLGVGIAIALLVSRFERLVDDGPIEMTLSLVTPYAAYVAAEAARGSGVLAVVACGLYLSRHSSEFFSARTRLQAYGLWEALDFILNGLVFLLIGLQLPLVLDGLHAYSKPLLLGYAVGFSVLVIALRLLWAYPGAYLAFLIRRHLLKQQVGFPSAQSIFVVGWTGMRGVVALAAALSLPETMANGQPFTSRNLILFLTFSVILVTLVLQGLTLPPIIRALRLVHETETDSEEEQARRLMLEAALAYMEQARSEDEPALDRAYKDLFAHHQARLRALNRRAAPTGESKISARHRSLSRELLGVERSTVLRLRKEGRISDTVLRRLERELDLSEARLGSP